MFVRFLNERFLGCLKSHAMIPLLEVLLRVLQKKERMAADSSSEFAALLWKVLKMPLPIFQSVVTFL